MGLSQERSFSDNRLVGDNGGWLLDNLDSSKAVRMLAWSEGCPVRHKVVRRLGILGAVERYGEVIFARQLVYEAARRKPRLYQELRNNWWRHVDESVGEYEENSVPKLHRLIITPNNTPWGYALPRLLLVQMGAQSERSSQRFLQGLNILDKAVADATSPYELVAGFAEGVARSKRFSGADQDRHLDQVLRATLSAGYLREENVTAMCSQLLRVLHEKSPVFWERYQALDPTSRQKLGIVNLGKRK